MRSTIRIMMLAAFATLALGQTTAWAQKTGYTAFRLAVSGAVSTEVTDLNDSSNVVGNFYDANHFPTGFFYQHASKTYVTLGAGANALGMNQNNQIVGFDNVWNVGRYWDSPTAASIPLMPLPGHTHSKAHEINNTGIIIGTSYIPEDEPLTPGFRAAVVWCVNEQGVVTGPVPLPFPAGHLIGVPRQLTESLDGVTTIVGDTKESVSTPEHAVQWSVGVDNAGVPYVVSGPIILSSAYAYGSGINHAKDVVGAAVFAENSSQWPYLKRNGQSVTKLPGISKATYGLAFSINNAGQIVGYQGYISRGYITNRAVLWTSPTAVVDLNSMVKLGAGESLTRSWRINNRGDILAYTNTDVPCLLIAK